MSIINENDIARCVRKAVEEYFDDLDGEKPHAIHDMVIKRAGGNQTRAAELLGINRNTLRNKIKLYQIT